MSVSKMKKLTVITPAEEADGLLRALMRQKAISLEKTVCEEGVKLLPRGSEKAVSEAASFAAGIDSALPTLTKRSTRKKSIFPQVIPVVSEEFKKSGRYESALKTVRETERIGEEIAEEKANLEAEEALQASLVPYLNYHLPIEQKGTETSSFLLGEFPVSVSTEKVRDELKEFPFCFEVLAEDKKRRSVFAICHNSAKEEVLKKLHSLGFREATWNNVSGTPGAVTEAASRRAAQCRIRIERLEARLNHLSEHLDDVEILSDMAHTEKIAAENMEKVAGTTSTAILTGWCPAQNEKRITALLENYTAAYEFAAPAEGEEPPVLLKNNGWAKNFEWVLGMYAYPKYGKFDPTFIMSIFYFLIFGMMFADAGYGLLLSVLCFLAVRLWHPREGMKRFLMMFGFCGISCILFGVLFGSYFGDFPMAFAKTMLKIPEENLPNLAILPMSSANIAVLFDPLQDPTTFLLISLGVGVVHLIAGMAVNAVILCCQKKPLDALFDVGSYWLLFGGIATVIFKRGLGIGLIAGGVLAILLTQGRRNKGFAGKLIGGLGGLYSLINFLSDLLSYSRILALGLASAVIGQVVNVMAMMIGPNFFGFIMMILVFVIGHALNLVINLLGTFVHTARLQYIEFFGKFYEDGGIPFQPLTPSEKYSAEVNGEEFLR